MSRVLQTPYVLSALRPTTTTPIRKLVFSFQLFTTNASYLIGKRNCCQGFFCFTLSRAGLPYPVEETGDSSSADYFNYLVLKSYKFYGSCNLFTNVGVKPTTSCARHKCSS